MLRPECYVSVWESNKEEGREIDQRHKCRWNPGPMSMFPVKKSSRLGNGSDVNSKLREPESLSYPKTSWGCPVRVTWAIGLSRKKIENV